MSTPQFLHFFYFHRIIIGVDYQFYFIIFYMYKKFIIGGLMVSFLALGGAVKVNAQTGTPGNTNTQAQFGTCMQAATVKNEPSKWEDPRPKNRPLLKSSPGSHQGSPNCKKSCVEYF